MRSIPFVLAVILFTLIIANLIVIDANLAFKKQVSPHDFTPTILATLTPLPTSTAPTTFPVPTPSNPVRQKSELSYTQIYIPLGSGSTQSSDWEDANGVESYIDTSNYPHIRSVALQVSMHIPTKNGIMSVRLFNESDGHPVWFSDVSTDSDISVLKSSGNITLSPGNKLYRVQFKTSLQYLSVLDFSRIQITYAP